MGRGPERDRSRAARLFAAVAAFVVGDLLRVRRAHAERAMTRAGVAEPSDTVRAMYRSLGRGLFELLRLSIRRGRHALAVRAPLAELEALRARGRGVVVATAHTGSWDVAACAMARVAPLTVVTKRLSVSVLDRLWQGTRRREGVRLTEAGRAARDVASALRRGEVVAMLVDQAPERARGVVRASFLGAPALVDLAPAYAAMRARAPLVAAFPYRDADGGHGVTLAGVFEPPARAERAWAEETMIAVTRLLDEHVRRRPEQWLWMHRRWKGAA
ncbi:MAG TPA: lysophospholipid acyltransferase family protein [Polyangiaceae bacterium]|nr:lysophospholipid acyltransferase family protein [Polyangiaceae bacterium]